MGYDESERFTSKPGTDCLSPEYSRVGYWGSDEYLYHRKVTVNDDGTVSIEGMSKRDSKGYRPSDNTDVFLYGDLYYHGVHGNFTKFIKAIGISSAYLKTLEKDDHGTYNLDGTIYDKIPDDVPQSDFTAYTSDAGITLYVSPNKYNDEHSMTLSTQAAIDIYAKVSKQPEVGVIWNNVASVKIAWDT